MTKYLLDSNIISYVQDSDSPFYDAVNEKLELLNDDDEVMISILTLYEHEYGMSYANDKQLKERLEKIKNTILELFYIMPLSQKGAEIFGELKACYKRNSDKKFKKGFLEKHNVDFMIASSAIDFDAVLVSNDKIFKRIQSIFPKLRLEDWTKQ
jgi:predicted nucleic acid-binding protein